MTLYYSQIHTLRPLRDFKHNETGNLNFLKIWIPQRDKLAGEGKIRENMISPGLMRKLIVQQKWVRDF